jgi:hypothetical protein
LFISHFLGELQCVANITDPSPLETGARSSSPARRRLLPRPPHYRQPDSDPPLTLLPHEKATRRLLCHRTLSPPSRTVTQAASPVLCHHSERPPPYPYLAGRPRPDVTLLHHLHLIVDSSASSRATTPVPSAVTTRWQSRRVPADLGQCAALVVLPV